MPEIEVRIAYCFNKNITITEKHQKMKKQYNNFSIIVAGDSNHHQLIFGYVSVNISVFMIGNGKSDSYLKQ